MLRIYLKRGRSLCAGNMPEKTYRNFLYISWTISSRFIMSSTSRRIRTVHMKHSTSAIQNHVIFIKQQFEIAYCTMQFTANFIPFLIKHLSQVPTRVGSARVRTRHSTASAHLETEFPRTIRRRRGCLSAILENSLQILTMRF